MAEIAEKLPQPTGSESLDGQTHLTIAPPAQSEGDKD
jgi:hypothetical protein